VDGGSWGTAARKEKYGPKQQNPRGDTIKNNLAKCHQYLEWIVDEGRGKAFRGQQEQGKGILADFSKAACIN